MHLLRRQFLRLAACAAFSPATFRIAHAQSYPVRPVHLIVGFAPGGANDIVARLMGRWLSERLGQQFVIENRPGAATNLATEAVVKASPDGYTLLLAGLPNAANASLYDKLSFDFLRDTEPVGAIVRVPSVLLVNPLVRANTLAEFIAHIKANPGKVNMGTAGTGSVSHLAGELFKTMAGLDIVNVPYRGVGPAVTGVLGGQVEFAFAALLESLDHIRSGKLRALAVTSEARSQALPDVPPVAEAVPGYTIAAWFGLVAPRGTPTAVIETINREINAGLADATLRARFAELGCAPIGGTPAEFGNFIADETAKWGKVIRTANIKAE
jgi:tripartite-type tricarboxylate transporter receptor subunit TctC